MCDNTKMDSYENIKQTKKDEYVDRVALDKRCWVDYLYERICECPMTTLMEELEYVFQGKR